MRGATRYAAGYVLDFFRERVGAGDLEDQHIRRVLIGSSLNERGRAAVRGFFPEAELRSFDGRTELRRIRRLRCDVVCIPMAGGEKRERLLGVLSGARHKLLMPSPEYLYRLGMRRGGAALLWAVVDRFFLAPIALLWLGISGLGIYAAGVIGRACAAERGRGPWEAERALVIRLTPTGTFVRLLDRMRRLLPRAHLAALLASEEGREEVAAACDEVISPGGGPAASAVRRLRQGGFDAVILAGGADYALGRPYVKAALAARLCPGARRYQWELGEQLPGTPLGRAVLRAARATGRRWAGRTVRPLGRWLLRRTYAQDPRRGPTMAQIGITKACNYHCVFCPFHNPQAERGHSDAELPRMSYEMFARLLGDLKRMGTRGVDICGDGEPLTHPDAMEMIALARDLGLDVTLATNGVLLTERRARWLVDFGVRRMHVSLNAAREETYARLHPGVPPGVLGTIVQRLQQMREYAETECRRPIEVEFSAVLTRLNMHEIGEMVEVAHEARADWLMLILMGPVEGGEELLLRPEDWLLLREDLEHVEARARRLGIRTNLEAIKLGASGAGTRSVYEQIPCYIGHQYALILADGSVMFCCQCTRALGNLQQDSFEHIWKSEAYGGARREARALPTTRQALVGCECFTACSHVMANLQVYRKLHGDRKLRKIL